MTRDFSTISPSAKSLLMLKAQTSLPFARQAAGLLFGASAVEEAAREMGSHAWGIGRRHHFEQRARSIDAAIEGDEHTAKFFEVHKVEEKKFENFAAASAFFDANGFAVAQRLSPAADPWPFRQTWVLEAR